MGDLASGFISHALKSRKKAVLALMLITLVLTILYLYGGITNSFYLYGLTAFLGFGIGYWAMFVTIGAEQFGTNLRATAATTIPNMVRGTVVGMTGLFGLFKSNLGVINSGALVSLFCFAIGLWAIVTIQESHDRDLDFLES